jgi:SAM-dependent methyltransferase
MQEGKQPYSGIPELADAELGLTNYYSNIVNLVADNFFRDINPGSKISILEFGAGTGFLSEILEEKYSVKAECLEIDKTLLEILKLKGFKTYSRISEVNKKYDLIFSSNVLEHIDLDVQVLSELKNLLKNEGKLVSYVPAFPILFSDLDVAVGHYRRYTKREICQKLQRAGYKVERIHYVDTLGFPASLLLRVLGYKAGGNIGGLKSMRIYDRFVFPFSKLLDRIGFKKLFGKNLIAYARVEA